MDLSALDAELDLSEGEWIEDDSGARFLVRSSNYPKFKGGSMRVGRKSASKLDTDEGGPVFIARLGRPIADHLLLNWDLSKAEGLLALTVKGKPATYSPELAAKTLTANDPYGIGNAFRNAVEAAANVVRDRLAEQAKEAAGN